MQFLKRGRSVSLRNAIPPLEDAGNKTQRSNRARWDLIQGIVLWELWTRLSFKEVKRRYKRTALGPAWMTISLLIFATIMGAVWAGLWHQKFTVFLPFLLSGLIPWTLISSVIGESTGAFLGGEGLMKNQQFPYAILINNLVARNLVVFAHNLIGFIIVGIFCEVSFSLASFMILPGLILVGVNCAWISLLVAILCLRYRDFQQIVASLIQIIVFVTPIFWYADQLQGTRALLVNANIFNHLVEVIRRPMLGQYASMLSYEFCIVSALTGWMFTYYLFTSKRHRLPYWF